MDMQTIIRDIFNEKKEVYSTVEVAKKLGISPKTIINQINLQIPYLPYLTLKPLKSFLL